MLDLGRIRMLKRKAITVGVYLMVIAFYMSSFIDFETQRNSVIYSILTANTFGCSIITNVTLLYFLKMNKYCIHVKLAVCSLLCFNLFNIMHAFRVIDYLKYCKIYDTLTISAMIISISVYYLYKHKKKCSHS